MTPPLRQKAKRNWRGLDKGERREWKIQLKTQRSKDEDHGIQSRLLMANRGGNNRSSNRLFSWAPNHWGWRLQPWNEKMFAPWKKSYGQPKQHIKKQRRYFVNKGLSSQSYGFSSSHVWMWELDYKESWAPKNWCFWTECWRRLLRVPWTARRSNQSILKKISPGISLEGMMLKLKLQYFHHLMKSWLIWKDPDAGKNGGQEEKGTTEVEMVGWHHRLDGHGFGWTPEVSDGWGGLACWFMVLQGVRHDWATELNPLQYSCLENPLDRGAWRDTVHRVTKSCTLLND